MTASSETPPTSASATKQMLAEVDAWQPPTEMHTGLKNFMRDQLTSSIEADCNATHTAVTFDTAEEYRDAEIHRLTTDLAHHRLQLLKAQARVSAQNDWIRTLWASLAAHPHNTALAEAQD